VEAFLAAMGAGRPETVTDPSEKASHDPG